MNNVVAQPQRLRNLPSDQVSHTALWVRSKVHVALRRAGLGMPQQLSEHMQR